MRGLKIIKLVLVFLEKRPQKFLFNEGSVKAVAITYSTCFFSDYSIFTLRGGEGADCPLFLKKSKAAPFF